MDWSVLRTRVFFINVRMGKLLPALNAKYLCDTLYILDMLWIVLCLIIILLFKFSWRAHKRVFNWRFYYDNLLHLVMRHKIVAVKKVQHKIGSHISHINDLKFWTTQVSLIMSSDRGFPCDNLIINFWHWNLKMDRWRVSFFSLSF